MTATKRKHVNLKTKLAATLLQMVRPDEHGQMVPVIAFARAKTLTVDEILSAFHFDHVKFVAFDGDNHPSNLVPRPVAEHIEKTRRDVKEIARVRRGLKKRSGRAKPKKKIRSRGFPSPQERKAFKARVMAEREART